MAEEKYDLSGDSGMKIPKGKFGLWLENFWYHYKWHTIFALVAILVVTICTVQMCSKEEYDVHIVYAGSEHLLGEKDEDGTVKAQTVMKSVNQAVEDFDGNGKILSSFESLYLLTDGEILELGAKVAKNTILKSIVVIGGVVLSGTH